MKRLLPLLLILFALPAFGQTLKYVDPSAMGSANGNDWTNAETSLSGVTPVRNEIIYVCDGTISGSITLSTAESSTQTIEIRKATDADHGTSTGWSNGMCDNQAVFSGPPTFTTGYWILNGVSRTSPTAGHGIRLDIDNAGQRGITWSGNNITLEYVELAGAGNDGNPSGANDLVYCVSGFSNGYIGYNYFHDAGRTFLLTRNCDSWTVEHNFFHTNEGNVGTEHGECWSTGGNSDNAIVRYNVFDECDGTAAIATVGGGNNQTGWEIYGNVFSNGLQIDNGVIATRGSSPGDNWTNTIVCNNTFYNNAGLQAGINITTGGGTWQVYNNIWYSNTANNIAIPGTHDYSYFSDNTDMSLPSESNDQTTTGDPFTDSANGDFTLAGATNAGFSSSPCSSYGTDPAGTTRGGDGTWDRGAYEFDSGGGDSTPPTIQILTPLDNATGVAITVSPCIDFDENVQAGTGNFTLKLTSDDSTVESFDVTMDVTITNSQACFTPSSSLSYSTGYYIQIAATAIDDLASPTPNSFAGILDTTTWNFTTAAIDPRPSAKVLTGFHP